MATQQQLDQFLTQNPNADNSQVLWFLNTQIAQTEQTIADRNPIGSFVGEMVSNIPQSASNVVSGFASLLTPSGLKDAGEFAGRAALGGVKSLFGQQDEDTKLAKAAFHEATRLFRDPAGTIKNDPVGALLDIASVVSGGASLAGRIPGQVGRLAQKAASIERKVNPLVIAGESAGTAAKRVGRRAKEAFIGRTGVVSGIGEEAVEGALRVGREGGQARTAFDAARKGEVVLEDLAGKVTTALDDAEDLRNLQFAERLVELDLKPGQTIDVAKTRAAIFDQMEKDWDITITPIESTAKKGPAGVVDVALNPDGGPGLRIDFNKSNAFKTEARAAQRAKVGDAVAQVAKWQDNGIQATHGTQLALDTIIEKGIDARNSGQMNALLTNMRRTIRKELGDKVEGFDVMQKDFGVFSEFLGQARKDLGVGRGGSLADLGLFEDSVIQGGFNQTLLTRLGNLLNTRTSQNLGRQRAFIGELEKVMELGNLKKLGVKNLEGLDGAKIRQIARDKGVSENIFASLAGLRFKPVAQQGAARMQGAGIGTVGAGLGGSLGFALGGGIGAGVGAAAGSGLQRLIGNMTIKNPRLVGRVLLGLGGKSDQIVAFVNTLQKVHDKVPRVGIARGMTIGAAVQEARKRVGRDPELQPLFDFFAPQRLENLQQQRSALTQGPTV